MHIRSANHYSNTACNSRLSVFNLVLHRFAEPESTVEDETGKSGAKPKVLVRQHASDEDAEGNDNQTTDTAEVCKLPCFVSSFSDMLAPSTFRKEFDFVF